MTWWRDCRKCKHFEDIDYDYVILGLCPVKDELITKPEKQGIYCVHYLKKEVNNGDKKEM